MESRVSQVASPQRGLASDFGPADFARAVRDALRHLHDPVYLQTHPLTRLLLAPTANPSTAGNWLHQFLIDTIASLRPGVSGDTRTIRRHELLTLRYVEALEIDDVAARLAISRREYNRVHRQALDAVISLLRERSESFLSTSGGTPGGVRRAPTSGRIPRPVTSFVGRVKELEAVRHLLDVSRLVTLTGPPGTGKTRLAVQIGMELAAATEREGGPFPDGVAFVALAAIRDPNLVISSIAQALDVGEAPHRSLVERVEDHLSERKALVILDNFEQVLEAASVVARLHANCAGLSVLVTSRASLRLSGEHEFSVPPLRVPEDGETVSLEQLDDYEAVRLYVDRAAALRSGFRLTIQNAPAVVELCHLLDGLPLAIELAAARSRVFPPYALLGRLGGRGASGPQGSFLTLLSGGARDAPDRHQTLRSAIDWSYRLLTRDEQRLFARLSTFAGGWTIEAAEAVCVGTGDLDVLEGIASLIDKSLIQQGESPDDEPRFEMLETIREHAREQLEILGEAASIRRRHAEHYLATAREAEANYWGPDQAGWQRILSRELDNLRAALAWSRDSGEVELALELGASLRMFWFDSGYRAEGREWLESALALAGPAHRTASRAAALIAAGDCHWLLNDLAASQNRFEESLDIWRELGDRRGMAWALQGLSVISAEQGERPGAVSLAEETLSLARTVGDRPLAALALHGLGIFAIRASDEETARIRIEESRQVWQEIGDREHLSLTSNNLGDLERSRGRFAEAASHYRESLELIGEEGPKGWRATYLRNLGHALYAQGDDEQARALFAQALQLYQRAGDRKGVAESVAGLAGLAAETQPARTSRLFGAATAVIEAMGSQLDPANRADYDRALTTARSQLGQEAFEAGWKQGRSLTLEQAISEALALFSTSTA